MLPTAPVFTVLSRSWCEHDTLALESVNCTIILTAFLVVVLELCNRYLDRVCVLEHVRPRAACTHSVVENSTTRNTCTSRSDGLERGISAMVVVCCLKTSN